MKYLLIIALTLVVACGGLGPVQRNLNSQRALFGLEPVAGDCLQTRLGFADYEPLVTTSLPESDAAYGVITRAECRTFRSHVDAFSQVCPEHAWQPMPTTIARCELLGGW